MVVVSSLVAEKLLNLSGGLTSPAAPRLDADPGAYENYGAVFQWYAASSKEETVHTFESPYVSRHQCKTYQVAD